MPEQEKPSLVEALLRGILQRIAGTLNRYLEEILKRILRQASLYLAGLVIALLGVVFVSLGVVKWLALIVPSWLAWVIVGIVLFLLGVVIALTAFIASRS